ncbi:stress response regulator protein 1 [Scheffersomyces xylosifermentans]|uniref:stress response regulator protein 1 n=1 Tax=Scheffersomyces xylosifermentans TaxID=1304137 RepID=UPI00315D7172
MSKTFLSQESLALPPSIPTNTASLSPASTASSISSNYTTSLTNSGEDYFSLKPKLSVSISRDISSIRSKKNGTNDPKPVLSSPLDYSTNSDMDEEDEFDDDASLDLMDRHRLELESDYSPSTPYIDTPTATIDKSILSRSPENESIDISLIIKKNLSNFTSYNFLIVDDNLINIKILEKVLMKLYPNCNIKKLVDPTKVAGIVQSHQFDVVFLDIEMPQITGVELSKDMRRQSKFDSVGIIAVTSRSLPEDLSVYNSVGIDYTFSKPLTYNYDYMMDRIDGVIQTRSSARAF